MAPTEILAQQHYEGLTELMAGLNPVAPSGLNPSARQVRIRANSRSWTGKNGALNGFHEAGGASGYL